MTERPAPGPETPSPETRVAFYKAVKFWLVFLLAVIAAAVVWKVFGEGEPDAPPSERQLRLERGELPFDHEVPEIIAFREHDYIKAVEAASEKQWYLPGEEKAHERALAAWEKTRAHARRLATDRKFRAAEQMAANIRHAPFLSQGHVLFRWAEPYLVGYVSEHPLHRWELDSAVPARGFRARRRRAQRLTKEYGLFLPQLYAEFRRRYAGMLELEDLMAPYGGRPDYKQGVRSYAEGCPLVVLIFEREEPGIPSRHFLLRGTGFSLRHGWVEVHDRGEAKPLERARRVSNLLDLATHQLIWWSHRQRNRWAKPRPAFETPIEDGIASMLASVHIGADRSLRFVDVHPGALTRLRRLAADAGRAGRPSALMPLELLFADSPTLLIQPDETVRTAGETGLLFAQRWAFAHFLHHFEGGGKYRGKLERYLDLATLRGQRDPKKDFERAIETFPGVGARWEALDLEFAAYVRDHLLKIEPSWERHMPPALEDWAPSD